MMPQACIAGTSERDDCEIPRVQIEVSVVMPCLNEARTVGVCVSKAVRGLGASGVAVEIILADNSSTDVSQAIAERAGARVIFVPRKGYGSALQGGIAAAKARFVVMGDADDSYDSSRIDEFVSR